MPIENLIRDASRLPVHARAVHVSHELAAAEPGKAILETSDGAFRLADFAAAGLCEAVVRTDLHAQVLTQWNGLHRCSGSAVQNGWFAVRWQGHSLSVLTMVWPEEFCTTHFYWVIGDETAVVTAFFSAVCEWCSAVRGEVLVFQSGDWFKSEELYADIQGATMDNLVLAGSLKEDILADFERFFESRELYQRYGIPWKRGVLFTGPPGNGKTHTVKALLNRLKQPCLYVKSFKSRFGSDQDNIRAVFHRARETTPSLLVMEDLDSLLDENNRSYFLNELDGFAANEGVVTLATTNHPERLDPSILDRPSRFDRKYPFLLPGSVERLAYLRLWNGNLQDELSLSDEGMVSIADSAEGFSFAYLKELFLSSMMRWISSTPHGGMDAVMLHQCTVLRDQMGSMFSEAPSLIVEQDGEEPFPFPMPV